MWLSDIENAVKDFRKVFGDASGFTSISFSTINNSIIFYTTEDYYYYFDLPSKRIEKRWNDTWRTGRREIIFEGNF